MQTSSSRQGCLSPGPSAQASQAREGAPHTRPGSRRPSTLLVPWKFSATTPASAAGAPVAPTNHYRDVKEPRAGPLRPSTRAAGDGTTTSAGNVDLDRAARAVADLLDALGLGTSSEHLAGTPRRVARAYAELLTPEPFEATTFPNDEGYDELVVARAIPFASLCEHHLLPFSGVAHVGYLPADRLVGLSKLARVVTLFSRRLQVQERLTTQVANWLCENLAPKGVGVVIEADHACMSLRGVRAGGSKTVTSSLAGLVRYDERTRAEFFSLVGRGP